MVIQQEILMMRDCRHENIVAYFGSYLRYFLVLLVLLQFQSLRCWSFFTEKSVVMVSVSFLMNG